MGLSSVVVHYCRVMKASCSSPKNLLFAYKLPLGFHVSYVCLLSCYD